MQLTGEPISLNLAVVCWVSTLYHGDFWGTDLIFQGFQSRREQGVGFSQARTPGTYQVLTLPSRLCVLWKSGLGKKGLSMEMWLLIRQREDTFLGEVGRETPPPPRKKQRIRWLHWVGWEWEQKGEGGGGPGKGQTEQEGSEGCEEFGLKEVSKVMVWMDGGYGPKVHVPEAWSLVQRGVSRLFYGYGWGRQTTPLVKCLL